MLEKLMKPGQFTIDYLNKCAQGHPDALAFYIRCEQSGPASYCIEAKHHLYTGLCFLKDQGLDHNLVAVYIDIDGPCIHNQIAFDQLLLDLSAGSVNHVFCIHPQALMGYEPMRVKLDIFQRERGSIDLISYDDLEFSSMLCDS